MRKTPLRPSLTPIPRYTELPRSTKKIRSRKKDPAKRAWAKHRCEPFLAWLRLQKCCITGKRTGELLRVPTIGGVITEWYERIHVDPAHIKTRGTGGEDVGNALPLSRHLHEEQHRIGWPAFEKRYAIDAKALARKYADEWLATEAGRDWLESQNLHT